MRQYAFFFKTSGRKEKEGGYNIKISVKIFICDAKAISNRYWLGNKGRGRRVKAYGSLRLTENFISFYNSKEPIQLKENACQQWFAEMLPKWVPKINL